MILWCKSEGAWALVSAALATLAASVLGSACPAGRGLDQALNCTRTFLAAGGAEDEAA